MFQEELKSLEEGHSFSFRELSGEEALELFPCLKASISEPENASRAARSGSFGSFLARLATEDGSAQPLAGGAGLRPARRA